MVFPFGVYVALLFADAVTQYIQFSARLILVITLPEGCGPLALRGIPLFYNGSCAIFNVTISLLTETQTSYLLL